jgi:hypothetical protein
MDYAQIREIALLQSLALTLPMLVLSGIVIWEIKALTFRGMLSNAKSKMEWIVMGIFFSFLGKCVESIWWFIPWTLSYVEHPAWADYNSAGVFINIIFRQGFFSFGAYCHLRAFAANGQSLRFIHWILLLTVVMGQLYPLYLIYFNGQK